MRVAQFRVEVGGDGFLWGYPMLYTTEAVYMYVVLIFFFSWIFEFVYIVIRGV